MLKLVEKDIRGPVITPPGKSPSNTAATGCNVMSLSCIYRCPLQTPLRLGPDVVPELPGQRTAISASLVTSKVRLPSQWVKHPGCQVCDIPSFAALAQVSNSNMDIQDTQDEKLCKVTAIPDRAIAPYQFHVNHACCDPPPVVVPPAMLVRPVLILPRIVTSALDQVSGVRSLRHCHLIQSGPSVHRDGPGLLQRRGAEPPA